MHSDVPNKLLHCIVFEVAIASMHLKGLIADLLSKNRLYMWKTKANSYKLIETHSNIQ